MAFEQHITKVSATSWRWYNVGSKSCIDVDVTLSQRRWVPTGHTEVTKNVLSTSPIYMYILMVLSQDGCIYLARPRAAEFTIGFTAEIRRNPRNPNAWIKLVSKYFVPIGLRAENNTFWKKSVDWPTNRQLSLITGFCIDCTKLDWLQSLVTKYLFF